MFNDSILPGFLFEAFLAEANLSTNSGPLKPTPEGRDIGLIEALQAHSSAKCSQAHERVYSLLSLSSTNQGKFDVDYSISEAGLYINVAVHGLNLDRFPQRSNRHVHVLAAATSHRTKSCERLCPSLDIPSWVPDWRQESSFVSNEHQFAVESSMEAASLDDPSGSTPGTSVPEQKQTCECMKIRRPCRCSGGFRIGPVYAADATGADVVLAAVMKTASPGMVKGSPVPDEWLNHSSDEQITEQATLIAEVWCGNTEAEKVFEDLGWKRGGSEYHRIWVDGRPTEPWKEGGLAQKGIFAIFDAATG